MGFPPTKSNSQRSMTSPRWTKEFLTHKDDEAKISGTRKKASYPCGTERGMEGRGCMHTEHLGHGIFKQTPCDEITEGTRDWAWHLLHAEQIPHH